jgi:hypothetical protein
MLILIDFSMRFTQNIPSQSDKKYIITTAPLGFRTLDHSDSSENQPPRNYSRLLPFSDPFFPPSLTSIICLSRDFY